MSQTSVLPSPERARHWSIWLTQQPSVTGSPGERVLPERLAQKIKATPALAGATTWLIPAPGDRLGRSCLAMLVRGRGPRTVLLTGHFDTVAIDDYGDLAPLATDPEPLRDALIARLAQPATPGEVLAKADFESGDFLPGRGLLDMKSGLAAGLAACEAFAADPDRIGNLLFVAVPDEEVNSVGARALAGALSDIEREHGIEVEAAINLDCIGDNGDGTLGRSIALGSVGKLLLTAHVVGVTSHASHPFEGINSGALAAAIAARVEWAPELADAAEGEVGVPPTLLSLKDGKQHYDVTTPDSTFVTWNALTLRRDARATLDIFRRLVAEAVEGLRTDLTARRAALAGPRVAKPAVPVAVLTTAELMDELSSKPGALEELAQAGEAAAGEGLSLPDQSRRLTDLAWRLSGRREAAVVIGFGSLPYPSVLLTQDAPAQRLRAAIDAAREAAAARHGGAIAVSAFFPGISDMSFLGEADTADVALIAANSPAWTSGVRWSGRVGGIPTVNIGPWGRDYHTPIERLHMPYAFEVLPGLLLDTARRVMA